MISAVVLCKNEENNIVDCIESLKWCNEILIIDDYSDDRTVDLAEKTGATVHKRHLENDFSSQRNYGLDLAKGEWVLFVDTDERISPSLQFEILSVTSDPMNQFVGYFFKRTDMLWGKKLQYGESGNVKLLRMAKKDLGQWRGKVHEAWDIKGKVGFLKNPIIHFPHQSITEFLKEINWYTDIRATELYDKKVKAYWFQIILYPSAKFVFNYFVRRGFLDGMHGIVFALFMSLHSFLVRGKLWLLWQKK